MIPAIASFLGQAGAGAVGGTGSGLLGLGKSIYGLVQNRKANRLNPEDFQYIPPALRENLASQRNRARSARMPGQGLTESKIRQSTAAGLKAAGGGSLSDKIAAAQGLIAGEQQALSGVGAQAAQFQRGEEQTLQQLMGQRAGFEARGQEKFEQTKLALKDAAAQNIFGGASGVFSGATQIAGAGQGQGQSQGFGFGSGGGGGNPLSINTGASYLSPQRYNFNQFQNGR